MKPAAENNLIGDQFFLTRQTANLMEDFSREINKSSSLYLLYGISAVGKSRLLRELTKRGVENHKFCWINFKPDSAENGTGNISTDSGADDSANDVKELMEAADERDVILADHFELASNKSKHQLFQSWSTDGVDKKINLIIATSTANFSEVKQLAQQYKIKIKSFQLMPCSMAEVEAFLGFYLFPSQSLNSLSIPSEVKKQLRNCNGVLGKIIEFASQYGEHISINPDTESESKNYTVFVVASLLLMLIGAGFIYQYWKQDVTQAGDLLDPINKTITIISDNEDVVSISQPDPDPTDTGGVIQSTNDSQEQQAISESPVIPEIELQNADNDTAVVAPTIESEAPGVEVEIAGKLEMKVPPTENEGQVISRYQRDLDISREWIEGLDKTRGTIQIMMIGIESFNKGAYHRYLERLKFSNIDVSEIRIYQTTINDSVAFGIIFGDYESRREASKYINQLPDALKAKEPIPRSIGKILDEITNK